MKKNKMKKGYWYEYTHGNEKWILQFSHTNKDGIHIFKCYNLTTNFHDSNSNNKFSLFDSNVNLSDFKEVEDFTNVFKYYPEEKGRWFKCILHTSSLDFLLGNNYKLGNEKTINSDFALIGESGEPNGMFENEKYFEEIKTKEENMKDLLQEAKKRFPVGTKFLPNHTGYNSDDFCLITEDSNFKYRGKDIIAYVDYQAWIRITNPKYGNTSLDRVVYNGTEWAPIIENINKVLIGYKLVKPEFTKAACAIEGYLSFGEGIRDGKLIELISINGIDRKPGFEKLKKAGVLDLWFEPVYEDVSKPVIVEMNSDQGKFELEILNGICTYKPDNKNLSKEFIEEIIDWYDKSNHNNFADKGFPYNLEVTSLKVGCKSGTLKKDWEKVLSLLK